MIFALCSARRWVAREDIDDLGRISRLQQTLAYLLLLQALRQSRQQRHVLFLVFERRDQQRDDVYGLAIGRAKVNAGLRDADGQELALDPVLVCVGYGHSLANARRGLLLAPNQARRASPFDQGTTSS